MQFRFQTFLGKSFLFATLAGRKFVVPLSPIFRSFRVSVLGDEDSVGIVWMISWDVNQESHLLTLLLIQ